jgi:predicted transglutaminase-like cysteine proteinase
MRGGVGFWKLVTWTSLLLAGALSMFDPLAPFPDATAPISLAPAESVGPVSFGQGTTNVVQPHDAAATKNDAVAQPFGMDTEPVTTGALFEKWRLTRNSIAQDLDVVSRCQANGPCPAPAQKLIGLSLEGAGRSGRARVGMINRAVDLAIRPVSDEAQWGVTDHWSNPLETLKSNQGDCEDYAIVKYAALLEAGLSGDDVKIVVLKNVFPSEYHAVVAVRTADQWFILDNRTLTLVRDMDMTRAIPEFVLGENGARRFVWSGRDRRAAS